MTGKQLCQLSLSDFHCKVPYDPGDLFWTHLELLRKCKFVGELLLTTVQKIRQGSYCSKVSLYLCMNCSCL
jgi:hypothetical protein